MSSTDIAATGAQPLVAQVYTNQPCVKQSGNAMITPTAVIDAGQGGPAMLLWQATAQTQSAPTGTKAVPVINEEGLNEAASALFYNNNAFHLPMLRRRALLPPVQPGQSFLQVAAAGGCVTDGNDTCNMVALYLGDMSVPVQSRLSACAGANGTNGEYTDIPFYCAGGPLLISVDATGWTQQSNTPIGATLYLDGTPIGYTGLNAPLTVTHLPMVGSDLVLTNVAPGYHQLALMANKGTICDVNDLWALTVVEMTGKSTAHNFWSTTPCPVQTGGGVLAGAPYTASGGVQIVMATVSGYALSAGEVLQAHVLFDGDPVGSMQVYATKPNMHLPLAGGDIAIGSLPPGTHQVQVVADDGMCTDQTDLISLTIVELFP